jgi:hypothetical protein
VSLEASRHFSTAIGLNLARAPSRAVRRHATIVQVAAATVRP